MVKRALATASGGIINRTGRGSPRIVTLRLSLKDVSGSQEIHNNIIITYIIVLYT